MSGLLVGATIVLVDGDPLHHELAPQWRLAAEIGATLMGASPGFLMACRGQGLRPAEEHDRTCIRQLCAAGSPLPPEGYRWVAEQFGDQVLFNVGSGGTDVCSGIVQGSPLQPVWVGEISGPALGVAAMAFDEDGRPVVDALGELVITAPMPSMPVRFWDDPDGDRYRAAYFDRYPGVWGHGDCSTRRRNTSVPTRTAPRPSTRSPSTTGPAAPQPWSSPSTPRPGPGTRRCRARRSPIGPPSTPTC